jgi:predicted Zn-dependent protease
MNWRKLALSILLSSAALAMPTHAQSDFKFTKVDLDLLRQSDQLDDYFSRNGMVFEDDETARYVESVGRRVLPSGEPPEHVTWKFRVLRDPYPNAFSLANGTVYIQTGLLSLLQNEAQLAAVLGHEETHVLNRHPYLGYRDLRKKTLELNIFDMAGSAAGGFGAISDAIGMAISNIAPVMLEASYFGYSRELEQEADMRGLAAMENAGYDPQEMAAVFRLLEQSEGPDHSPALYRDHPRLEARIQYLTDYLKKNPPTNRTPLLNASIYLDSTEAVSRHDITLQIEALRPRHAVTIALDLVKQHPTSQHYALLGDAYRAMGGRQPNPSDEQMEDERRQEAKALSKRTPQEYEKSLLDSPEGQTYWQQNRKEAEEAYQKAIQLDGANAKAHLGLALVYDDADNKPGAIAEYQKYLDLAPTAWDRTLIQSRLDTLSAPAAAANTPAPARYEQQAGAKP